MKKATGPLFFIASLILTLIPSQIASAQQSDSVFVGRGRVARRDARGDRATAPRAPERERERERDIETDDYEMKPMAGGHRLEYVESLEQQCLNEVNRVREAHGLAPLEFSERLLEVARDYSRRMAEENFFSHTDPEGNTVRQRVDRANIRWRMIGENLAYSKGYISPVAASMTGWMDSPGHRRNILDPNYRLSAIGAWVSANGTVYFTEIFLR
ncbi:MAG TPA: CAP domain-containing protein [Blastocatellia bacterium]|nr:CAP domain-containing protein [Blastocatellia bacterium]